MYIFHDIPMIHLPMNFPLYFQYPHIICSKKKEKTMWGFTVHDFPIPYSIPMLFSLSISTIFPLIFLVGHHLILFHFRFYSHSLSLFFSLFFETMLAGSPKKRLGSWDDLSFTVNPFLFPFYVPFYLNFSVLIYARLSSGNST